MDIQKNKIGFNKLSYTLSALPVFPYLKLQGFSSDGITFEDVEIAEIKKGADGLSAINQKPVVYQGSFSLLPNSPSRKVLDNLIQLSTVDFGRDAIDYELILTENNATTGETTILSGGIITSSPSGSSANMDDGQVARNYVMKFSYKVVMPLS